ncbi:hypothetical protein SNEBB_006128 [Seison nebaliae]|nr:hypothetical protein SNEBB_006128 [Seison nebaliae]
MALNDIKKSFQDKDYLSCINQLDNLLKYDDWNKTQEQAHMYNASSTLKLGRYNDSLRSLLYIASNDENNKVVWNGFYTILEKAKCEDVPLLEENQVEKILHFCKQTDVLVEKSIYEKFHCYRLLFNWYLNKMIEMELSSEQLNEYYSTLTHLFQLSKKKEFNAKTVDKLLKIQINQNTIEFYRYVDLANQILNGIQNKEINDDSELNFRSLLNFHRQIEEMILLNKLENVHDFSSSKFHEIIFRFFQFRNSSNFGSNEMIKKWKDILIDWRQFIGLQSIDEHVILATNIDGEMDGEGDDQMRISLIFENYLTMSLLFSYQQIQFYYYRYFIFIPINNQNELNQNNNNNSIILNDMNDRDDLIDNKKKILLHMIYGFVKFQKINFLTGIEHFRNVLIYEHLLLIQIRVHSSDSCMWKRMIELIRHYRSIVNGMVLDDDNLKNRINYRLTFYEQSLLISSRYISLLSKDFDEVTNFNELEENDNSYFIVLHHLIDVQRELLSKGKIDNFKLTNDGIEQDVIKLIIHDNNDDGSNFLSELFHGELYYDIIFEYLDLYIRNLFIRKIVEKENFQINQIDILLLIKKLLKMNVLGSYMLKLYKLIGYSYHLLALNSIYSDKTKGRNGLFLKNLSTSFQFLIQFISLHLKLDNIDINVLYHTLCVYSLLRRLKCVQFLQKKVLVCALNKLSEIDEILSFLYDDYVKEIISLPIINLSEDIGGAYNYWNDLSHYFLFIKSSECENLLKEFKKKDSIGLNGEMMLSYIYLLKECNETELASQIIQRTMQFLLSDYYQIILMYERADLNESRGSYENALNLFKKCKSFIKSVKVEEIEIQTIVNNFHEYSEIDKEEIINSIHINLISRIANLLYIYGEYDEAIEELFELYHVTFKLNSSQQQHRLYLLFSGMAINSITMMERSISNNFLDRTTSYVNVTVEYLYKWMKEFDGWKNEDVKCKSQIQFDYVLSKLALLLKQLPADDIYLCRLEEGKIFEIKPIHILIWSFTRLKSNINYDANSLNTFVLIGKEIIDKYHQIIDEEIIDEEIFHFFHIDLPSLKQLNIFTLIYLTSNALCALEPFVKEENLNPKFILQLSIHWHNYGYLMESISKYSVAQYSYSKSLKYDPSNIHSFHNLALLYRKFSKHINGIYMRIALNSTRAIKADESRVWSLFARLLLEDDQEEKILKFSNQITDAYCHSMKTQSITLPVYRLYFNYILRYFHFISNNVHHSDKWKHFSRNAKFLHMLPSTFLHFHQLLQLEKSQQFSLNDWNYDNCLYRLLRSEKHKKFSFKFLHYQLRYSQILFHRIDLSDFLKNSTAEFYVKNSSSKYYKDKNLLFQLSTILTNIFYELTKIPQHFMFLYLSFVSHVFLLHQTIFCFNTKLSVLLSSFFYRFQVFNRMVEVMKRSNDQLKSYRKQFPNGEDCDHFHLIQLESSLSSIELCNRLILIVSQKKNVSKSFQKSIVRQMVPILSMIKKQSSLIFGNIERFKKTMESLMENQSKSTDQIINRYLICSLNFIQIISKILTFNKLNEKNSKFISANLFKNEEIEEKFNQFRHFFNRFYLDHYQILSKIELIWREVKYLKIIPHSQFQTTYYSLELHRYRLKLLENERDEAESILLSLTYRFPWIGENLKQLLYFYMNNDENLTKIPIYFRKLMKSINQMIGENEAFHLISFINRLYPSSLSSSLKIKNEIEYEDENNDCNLMEIDDKLKIIRSQLFLIYPNLMKIG